MANNLLTEDFLSENYAARAEAGDSNLIQSAEEITAKYYASVNGVQGAYCPSNTQISKNYNFVEITSVVYNEATNRAVVQFRIVHPTLGLFMFYYAHAIIWASDPMIPDLLTDEHFLNEVDYHGDVLFIDAEYEIPCPLNFYTALNIRILWRRGFSYPNDYYSPTYALQPAFIPVVRYNVIFDSITAISFRANCQVMYEYGFAIQHWGFRYGIFEDQLTFVFESTSVLLPPNFFFNAILDGQPGHTYFVQAFATTEKGTGYSQIYEVQTQAVQVNSPVLGISQIEISSTFFTFYVEIISGQPITEINCDGCFSIAPDKSSATGQIIDLTPDTEYTVRGWATNPGGTTEVFLTFTTLAVIQLPVIEMQLLNLESTSAYFELWVISGLPIMNIGCEYINWTADDNTSARGELSGLTPNTQYTLQGWASNEGGTTETSLTFTTPAQ